MSAILYYITGHGYGHAVRSNQVIRRLLEARSDLKIHVRTTAPDWLFSDPFSRVTHSHHSIDVGVIQRDSLQPDLGATLRACEVLHADFPRLKRGEVAFIQDHNIRLIAGDIPPLCFEIAAQAGIPSVAIANFTWSWIYRGYIREYPAFSPLVDEMESFYGKATLALTLPYSCAMDIFPRQEPVPWIARVSALTKEEAREKFHLPKSATIVLLTFGGLGLQRFPWHKLKEFREFFFVTTGAAESRDGNVFILPDAQPRFEDLLRGVDLIVTKPGYGIVADVIAHRLLMLHTDLGDFPEYPFLLQALNDLATAEFISQQDLLSGKIDAGLNRLLVKEPNWRSVSLDGGRVAAKRILELLDGNDG
ncbi:MAG TPA: glycosyltransferase family protein [Candidatus Udaeobacter sp.]|nr:glycosyltransferase family protein [Candidatus Udaeobacter sp.]